MDGATWAAWAQAIGTVGAVGWAMGWDLRRSAREARGEAGQVIVHDYRGEPTPSASFSWVVEVANYSDHALRSVIVVSVWPLGVEPNRSSGKGWESEDLSPQWRSVGSLPVEGVSLHHIAPSTADARIYFGIGRTPKTAQLDDLEPSITVQWTDRRGWRWEADRLGPPRRLKR